MTDVDKAEIIKRVVELHDRSCQLGAEADAAMAEADRLVNAHDLDWISEVEPLCRGRRVR